MYVKLKSNNYKSQYASGSIAKNTWKHKHIVDARFHIKGKTHRITL